jgi:SAM-dependent methyltransferase
MITSWFGYDFGYSWPLTLGHLLVFATALALAALAAWLGWRRWLVGIFALVAGWGLAGAVAMHYAVQINEPLRLPTGAFLASGSGRVLDLGAGSGRATVGLLLARSNARVMAVDLYQGYYGIDDNTADRLRRNAATAGVGDRVEVTTADMRQLPFGEAEFDAAMSVAAIDHLRWPDVEQAMREAARVLRPGGQFLVVSLNADAWVRTAMPLSLHGHGYWGRSPDRDRWRETFARSGFDVKEVGTAPATLYWLAIRR